MFTLKEFGNRISMLRKLQNLTQDELAERIHVSKDLHEMFKRLSCDIKFFRRFPKEDKNGPM